MIICFVHCSDHLISAGRNQQLFSTFEFSGIQLEFCALPTRHYANAMVQSTAEHLIERLLAQLKNLLCFLRLDLSPVVLERGMDPLTDQQAVALIAGGQNTSRWVMALRGIHRWTELAHWEQDWLEENGGSQPRLCTGSHGLGTMSLFIRQLGLPSRPSTTKSLQHGRKLLRFEEKFGPGIALCFIPVLQLFRQLSMAEEAKAVEILQDGNFANVRQIAQSLTLLRHHYQQISESSSSNPLGSIALNKQLITDNRQLSE